jgi:tRNA-2-methylthio-N6-dimethylallyladenosine synthase
LAERGFRDVTLLGQNVNSYRDGEHDFADLMCSVASIDPSVRVRFMTSHPQDMSEKLVEAIASKGNICKSIHLPVQSGSNRILELMNRTYTIEHYLALVERIRTAIPGASLTTDIISGFPTETEEEHNTTIDLIKHVRYDGAYTFKYSSRENTKAWQMIDNVPEEEKGQRVFEISELQKTIARELNNKLIGVVERVLVEGASKKSDEEWMGRTNTNKTVVFPRTNEAPGEYLDVLIRRVNSATLFGDRVRKKESNMGKAA